MPSAPRLRGCSGFLEPGVGGAGVGPAPAGVLLCATGSPPAASRRPRACGGAPVLASPGFWDTASAPRLRGCSRHRRVQPATGRVGPAPAGVLRSSRTRSRPSPRRPRACGGAPASRPSAARRSMSAPRLRGCSLSASCRWSGWSVGPAPAGVLRSSPRPSRPHVGRPRACGGAPPSPRPPPGPGPSAPPPAGVLWRRLPWSARPRSRPGACGGAPSSQVIAMGTLEVGPAPAGVLRGARRRRGPSPRRPRACGGAPARQLRYDLDELSAPRLRGRSEVIRDGGRTFAVGLAPGGCSARHAGPLAHLLSAPRPRGCSLPLAYGVGEPAVGPADWQSPSGAAADRNRPAGETPGLGLSRRGWCWTRRRTSRSTLRAVRSAWWSRTLWGVPGSR